MQSIFPLNFERWELWKKSQSVIRHGPIYLPTFWISFHSLLSGRHSSFVVCCPVFLFFANLFIVSSHGRSLYVVVVPMGLSEKLLLKERTFPFVSVWPFLAKKFSSSCSCYIRLFFFISVFSNLLVTYFYLFQYYLPAANDFLPGATRSPWLTVHIPT